MLRFKLAIWLA